MSFRVLKTLALANILVFAQLPSSQSVANPAAAAAVANKTISLVTCGNAPLIPVLDEALVKVIFQAPKYEPVKVFQGWETGKKTVSIKGKPVTFFKVQITSKANTPSEGVGWVAEQSIVELKSCPGADLSPPKMLTPVPITGLSDPKCCQFPLLKKPTESFLTGMRRFGAGRGAGRVHGAADLYGKLNDPIVSVTAGKVIRQLYVFYQGTYAMDVKHDGGFIVRYGEITGKAPKGTALNQSVQQKQLVGYMGVVNSKCCEPMLHFELYSGKGKGALNQGGNKYQRRGDIMNPTSYLRMWESKSL